jgi:hypothetical protein
MTRTFLLIFLLLLATTGNSQKIKTRFPVWSFNTDSTRIIGIGTGFASIGYTKNTTIGIHLELFGLAEMVVHGYEEETDDSASIAEIKSHISPKRVYGINISGLGMFCRSCDVNGLSINGMMSVLTKSNGISISGLGNYAELMNGAQISVLLNSAVEMRGLQVAPGFNEVSYNSVGIQIGIKNHSKDHTGLQIGLFNKADKLKGLQVGLWNVNSKRKLPFINW